LKELLLVYFQSLVEFSSEVIQFGTLFGGFLLLI
jgi:hypothetical protein